GDTIAIGDDQILINDGDFSGAVAITTGIGNDSVNIDTFDTDKYTAFHGKLTITLGDGDDSAALGRAGDPNDFILADDVVTVTGATGSDTLTRFLSNNEYLLPVVFSLDIELMNYPAFLRFIARWTAAPRSAGVSATSILAALKAAILSPALPLPPL